MDMDIMHADEAKICTPVCSEEWLAPISHQRHFPVTPQTFCATRAETPSEDPQFCASLHYPTPKMNIGQCRSALSRISQIPANIHVTLQEHSPNMYFSNNPD